MYSPGLQLEHFDRVASLSSPKAQNTQEPGWEWRIASVPSSSMYLPAGQSSHAAAPAPLYLPSGHTVHVSSIDLSPFSLEYFPAVQLTQVRKEEEFWELSNQVPFGHRLVGIGVGRREGVGGAAASNPFAESPRRRSPATTVLATILCEHRGLSQ